MTTCTSCGAPATYVNEEGGYATCDACEDRYQAALAKEFPLGYCPECGGKGYEHVDFAGKVTVRYQHSEGGCSQFCFADYEEDGR